MSVPGNINQLLIGAAGAGGGSAYEIQRSLRFNSADTAYLNRTPSSAGNRTTWTWSGWVKKTQLAGTNITFAGAYQNGSNYSIIDWSSDTLRVQNLVGGSYTHNFVTNQVFRDSSAWFHLVVSSNSSTSFAIYVNGTQITDFSTETGPSADDWFFNSTNGHFIGQNGIPGFNFYLNAYLTEIHFVDGQALAATDFGAYDTNNVWRPKEYAGTYGTNGFYLKFDNNNSTTALGLDSSGNNNDWTVNNFSVSPGSNNDSLIDTPTNYTADSGNNGGNYCTFNPLHPLTSGSSVTNGNLEATVFGGNDRGRQVLSTINPDSGKYYFEITPTNIGTTYIGLLMPVSVSSIGDARVAGYRSDGLVFKDGVNLGAVASTYAANDVIGVAYDIEGAEAKFYKNGTLEYTVSGITSSLVNVSPSISCDSSGSTNSTTGVANFGQRSFAYTPPTDHLSICTKNLATPTIDDGSTAMDVALWTGNSTARDITGFNMSPDLVWIKKRNSATFGNNHLFDTVRGATLALISNDTQAEQTETTQLTAFNSDGFSLGTSPSSNATGDTYVAWAWDAGTSTVSNTDGTITSQVRANTTAGFSIVSYTGTGSNATIGHGLSAAPEFIVVKDRDNSVNWGAGHNSPTWVKYFHLNLNLEQQDSALVWQDTAPTSSVFSVGTSALINSSGNAFIAYCFAPVEGYSAFGSYTGNASTDGPFVYTGFKPAFLLIKIYDGDNSNWLLLDSTRDTYNVVENNLYADEASAENQFDWVDFLSNGFKVKNGSLTQINGSGFGYMYAAFAENPFQANGGIAR